MVRMWSLIVLATSRISKQAPNCFQPEVFVSKVSTFHAKVHLSKINTTSPWTMERGQISCAECSVVLQVHLIGVDEAMWLVLVS